MIRKIAALGAGALTAVGCGGAALAANCATISISPASPSIPAWNPLNPGAQEATFVVSVTRAATTTKSLRLIFLDANSNAAPVRIGTSQGPRYRIINTDTGTTVSFPQGTQITGQSVANTQFGNGSPNTVNVNMKLQIVANTAPSEDFTGGAVFTETLNYAVQCFRNSGNGGGNPTTIDALAASNLTPSLTIPRLASIVTAAPATINFGNFTTSTQTAQVSVKSTSTLDVAVSTTNSGKLVRSGAVAPVPANSFIAYGMTFRGVTIAPGATLTNQTRAGVLGSSYPLRLDLTDGIPSGKLAGTYSDTITLTITPGQ